MELESVSSSFSTLSSYEEEKKPWEEWGKISFVAFALIGLAAAPIACLRKKRLSVSGIATTELAAPVVEINLSESEELLPPALQCTQEQASKVVKLFTMIANFSIWDLFSLYELNQLGSDIRASNIHPFAFLLNAPKQTMKTILQSKNSIKVEAILSGVREGISKAMKENQVYPHLIPFAGRFGKSPDRIKQLIQADDAPTSLLHYLFEIPDAHGTA